MIVNRNLKEGELIISPSTEAEKRWIFWHALKALMSSQPTNIRFVIDHGTREASNEFLISRGIDLPHMRQHLTSREDLERKLQEPVQ